MGDNVTLVTGAGGFIGGRAVEVLHGLGIGAVRAGVRRWASAARIGRLPVEIVQCDLTAAEQVDGAVAGTRAIVHCAVGSRSVTVDGTRTLLEAALRHRVERVVHLSTIDVYGGAAGEIDEARPYAYGGSEYGDAKIDAEKVCWEFAERGLSIAVIRPTIVYGPFSALWTVEFAERLQSRPWRLPAATCQGTCNLVYVDDVIAGVLRALEQPAAAGEAFQVNGPDRPTWDEYFTALNRAMGLPPLVYQDARASRLGTLGMQPVRATAKLVLRHFERPVMALYQRSRLARAVMRRAESSIRKTPTTAEFTAYNLVADYSTAKAERLLGYRPSFTMDRGIELSVAWLRHHGYLASPASA